MFVIDESRLHRGCFRTFYELVYRWIYSVTNTFLILVSTSLTQRVLVQCDTGVLPRMWHVFLLVKFFGKWLFFQRYLYWLVNFDYQPKSIDVAANGGSDASTLSQQRPSWAEFDTFLTAKDSSIIERASLPIVSLDIQWRYRDESSCESFDYPMIYQRFLRDFCDMDRRFDKEHNVTLV